MPKILERKKSSLDAKLTSSVGEPADFSLRGLELSRGAKTPALASRDPAGCGDSGVLCVYCHVTNFSLSRFGFRRCLSDSAY